MVCILAYAAGQKSWLNAAHNPRISLATLSLFRRNICDDDAVLAAVGGNIHNISSVRPEQRDSCWISLWSDGSYVANFAQILLA
jgi:hypothetical protein